MKYYLIAGEKSGDLHGSNLIKELKKLDSNAEIRAWGGDEMQKAGANLVRHYSEMAFMGFWEVFKNLLTIKRFLKECESDLKNYKPDVLILIDYAGFNLRVAAIAKNLGIRVFYYISPKVWAWNQRRALKIKKLIDKMFVIMHFEKAFYKKFDYEVDYVGNPIFDAIRSHQSNPKFLQDNNLSDKPIIALLPGSRKQELAFIFPTMLETARQFLIKNPDYQFVVAGVNELPHSFYEQAIRLGFPVIKNDTYNLLSHSVAALVTSGTATLEVALFQVPQVVCYKTSWLTYQIAKNLIKVKYISLVNLIADKMLVRELIQNDLNLENLMNALEEVLGKERTRILREYEEMKKMIATESASKETARLIWKYLNQ
ncbi:MAG: lipid-A-disaccharide synthase [Flammeovirgaceae bacterium]